MRLTPSRIALAIAVGALSITCLAAQPTSGTLSAPLRAHLQNERFDVVTSIRGLPLDVRNELQKLWGSDPGHRRAGHRVSAERRRGQSAVAESPAHRCRMRAGQSLSRPLRTWRQRRDVARDGVSLDTRYDSIRVGRHFIRWPFEYRGCAEVDPVRSRQGPHRALVILRARRGSYAAERLSHLLGVPRDHHSG